VRVPEIADAAALLLATYGVSDEAVLDVVFGRARPEGRLPFDLPQSMAALEEHPPDLPGGTVGPLLRFGDGTVT
jgi:beta-glucosidase